MIERVIDERAFRDLCWSDDKINEHVFSGSKQCAFFLEKLYGAKPPGWLLVWTRDKVVPYPISTMNNFYITNDISDLSTRNFVSVLFSIALRRREPTFVTMRDTQLWDIREVVALPGFWIVIPIQSQIHRQKNIPSSIGEALKFIKSKCMKPDIIIDTGYELQVHWNFEQLEIFDSEGSIYKIKQMSRDFQQEIIKEGKKCGWQLNDTSYLNALLRVPGTFNWRLYPPKPVTILEPKENVWKFY